MRCKGYLICRHSSEQYRVETAIHAMPLMVGVVCLLGDDIRIKRLIGPRRLLHWQVGLIFRRAPRHGPGGLPQHPHRQPFRAGSRRGGCRKSLRGRGSIWMRSWLRRMLSRRVARGETALYPLGSNPVSCCRILYPGGQFAGSPSVPEEGGACAASPDPISEVRPAHSGVS